MKKILSILLIAFMIVAMAMPGTGGNNPLCICDCDSLLDTLLFMDDRKDRRSC